MSSPSIDTIPGDFQESFNGIAPNFASMADSMAVPGEDWITTVQRALTAIVMTDQQRQLMQLNIERAKQGLPPVNPAEYGGGVNVGLSAETRQLLMYGGLAFLAVYLLKSRR